MWDSMDCKTPFWITRPRMWDLHFQLGHGSDTICNDSAQLCRYCPLWNPCPSRFCSPSKHTTMGEKASTHWREIIPYKHILMCCPRWCWIPWNVRPSFLGHYRTSLSGPLFSIGPSLFFFGPLANGLILVGQFITPHASWEYATPHSHWSGPHKCGIDPIQVGKLLNTPRVS